MLLRTDVNDELPLAIPREDDSLIQRFFSVPQDRFDRLSTDIELTLRSLQLPHATGVNLDVIGHSKGPLGLRRGRGDGAYRQYLRALPNAFGGQYRHKDVRTAVASGVVSDDETDVSLDEDVTTNSYSITLRSWQGHDVSLVEFLADYADAPVVTLDLPITYDRGVGPPRELGSGAGTAATVDHGTGPPRIGDTGGMSGVTVYEDGWGNFDFDEGWRFDVEEPGEASVADSTYGEQRTVDYGDTRHADSPLAAGGELTVGGELSIRN